MTAEVPGDIDMDIDGKDSEEEEADFRQTRKLYCQSNTY